MSKILTDFTEAQDYFECNFVRANKKYTPKISEFKDLYNKIAIIPTEKLTAKQGTAIAIVYRALKFTFASFNLILHGHSQESSIIQRNVQELRLVYLDIALNDSAYDLWELAQEKKGMIKKDNIIDAEILKRKIIEDHGGEILASMKVEASIKRLKKMKIEYIDGVLNTVVDRRNAMSEYFSHENIFNLVCRMDVIELGAGQRQTETYIGLDADSNMIFYLDPIINVLKELKEDIDFILKLE